MNEITDARRIYLHKDIGGINNYATKNYIPNVLSLCAVKRTVADDVNWSLAFLSDFLTAKEAEVQENDKPLRMTERRWEPSLSSTLKLNVDACINERLNCYSVGGVLWHKQGRLLTAFGKQINQPLSVVHGELLAIREGTKLLYEKNFEDVQIAADSLLAIQTVKSVKDDVGYIGQCTLEVREDLKKPVISDIIHVFRSTNNVAHNLALFASSSPPPVVWRNEEFPS